MPAQTIDPAKLGPKYTAELRVLLNEAKEKARRRHRQVSGIESAVMYSESIRSLLVHHVGEVARRLDCADMEERICLVAVGGFGRYEMGLSSDLDFLFLTENTPAPRDEDFIKAVLYSLWDLKFDLGYAVHSVRDCLKALGEDLHRTTSLLETRYIWGEPGIGEELADRVHSRLRKKYLLWFIETLHQEVANRHHEFSNTVFLLEPNVKDSVGGLRDIHVILWIAFALFGSADLDILLENGYVAEEERTMLLESWAFLLDLRNSLHISEGRKIDQLTFARQIHVAGMMGFEQTDLALAEEQLMRAYYDRASFVEKLSARLMETTLRRTPGTQLHAQRNEPPRQIDRDFWLRGDKLWIEERDLESIRMDIYWPIRLFVAAARTGAQPSDASLRYVEEHMERIDAKRIQASALVRDDFLRLLQFPGMIGATLRSMNRCSFLSGFFPEWTTVRNLPRIDHYHQYTVDEHLIRSVEVAEHLQADKPPKGMEHVANVAKGILRIDLLHFALLLHDIGKGEGRGHVIRGMHSIMRIAERLGMRQIEREVLRSLVANHQKMAQMVMRRDIEDPALAKELADAVPNPELLKMLYVHSACDLAAVSNESWNDWRGRLLALLFERTLDVMRGIEQKPPPAAPTHELIGKVWNEIERMGASETVPGGLRVEDFLTDMPERYLRSVSPADIALHFLLSAQVSEENRLMHRVDIHEESDYVEITFVARDTPGLFSSLCRGLSAKGFNILSAQIYTAHSGEAVDVFQVKVPPAFMPSIHDMLGRLSLQLNKMLETGEEPKWPSALVGGKAMPITPARLDLRPPRVDINNDMSTTHTVVEVRSPDRPGLLSRISEVFDDLRINLDLAFIATESYQVVDVFYVTDMETNKIVEKKQLNTLHDALLGAIRDGLELPGSEENGNARPQG